MRVTVIDKDCAVCGNTKVTKLISIYIYYMLQPTDWGIIIYWVVISMDAVVTKMNSNLAWLSKLKGIVDVVLSLFRAILPIPNPEKGVCGRINMSRLYWYYVHNYSSTGTDSYLSCNHLRYLYNFNILTDFLQYLVSTRGCDSWSCTEIKDWI